MMTIPTVTPNRLDELLANLPEDFKNSQNYKSALIHKSYYFESDRSLPHNERLEFLGDAALGLCVAALLFERFEVKDEGFLTKMRSQLVNTKILAEKAKLLGLSNLIKVGKSEQGKDSELSNRLLASSLEALFGAIYIERGFSYLMILIGEIFSEELQSEDLLLNSGFDWKSKLQESYQKSHQKTPLYELVSSEGPDHQKVFLCKVSFEGVDLGQGSGFSRKEAEQEAAKQALQKNLGEKSE